MKSMFDAALVIARRDFTATVFSRTFLMFLVAPLLVMVFSVLLGSITGRADSEAKHPVVAVIAAQDTAEALQASHQRLTQAMGRLSLPQLELVDPAEDVGAQARALLGSSDGNVSLVFSGTLERPTMTGPKEALKVSGRELALVLNDARRATALRQAGAVPAPVEVTRVVTANSAGSLNFIRYSLARGGQFLLFFLTLMLATMLLSNFVEEKSNKVIEVLAAAVPLDAIFVGKLMAMLTSSLVGIIIWGCIGAAGLLYLKGITAIPVTPAVGWPLYCILGIFYYISNFMLFGAMFLGIGGQASNVREVQTLSLPITMAQLAILALASAAVGNDGGTLTYIAAIFPLSSPLTMIALAAQDSALWPHLIALIWQALWVWIIVKVAAALFRTNVLKSGPSYLPAFMTRKA